MHSYTATVVWKRATDAPFKDNKFSRAHEWHFDGGTVVPASSSPLSVRVPLSNPAAVDPEEALVAAVSSCHMLFFLSFAAAGGFVIDLYEDEAVGEMAKNTKGAMAIVKVRLPRRLPGCHRYAAAVLGNLEVRARWALSAVRVPSSSIPISRL
jgi:organic hydroperoxide reductase OsmC/OhrA